MAGEYTRENGSMCNIPQDFADQKIGSCPFCGTEDPGWLTKEEWKVIGSNNYYFKCPCCDSEFKVPKVCCQKKLHLCLTLPEGYYLRQQTAFF